MVLLLEGLLLGGVVGVEIVEKGGGGSLLLLERTGHEKLVGLTKF